MNFINNFSAPITLAAGVDALEIALPDGQYLLTISGMPATRWEIVSALVSDGTATLTRGMEGTEDQPWPVGSVIYCSITAGQIGGLFDALASLAARVVALESAAPPADRVDTYGPFSMQMAASSAGSSEIGWHMFLNKGSLVPSQMDLVGTAASLFQLEQNQWGDMSLGIEFTDEIVLSAAVTVAILGVGEFVFTEIGNLGPDWQTMNSGLTGQDPVFEDGGTYDLEVTITITRAAV